MSVRAGSCLAAHHWGIIHISKQSLQPNRARLSSLFHMSQPLSSSSLRGYQGSSDDSNSKLQKCPSNVQQLNAPWTEAGRTTKKRLVALLVGYTGTGYRGSYMQKNTSIPTIERALAEAIYQSGLVLPSNQEVTRMGWGTSSRTDKGVHSSCSVVKCKVELDKRNLLLAEEKDRQWLLKNEGWEVNGQKTPQNEKNTPSVCRLLREEVTNIVNSHLPDNIRVLSTARVAPSFKYCTSRTYEFLIPQRALPFLKYATLLINNILVSNFPGHFSKYSPISDSLTMNSIDSLQRIWRMFEGEHNFHNFTAENKLNKLLKEEIRKRRRELGQETDSDDDEEQPEEGKDISEQYSGAQNVQAKDRKNDVKEKMSAEEWKSKLFQERLEKWIVDKENMKRGYQSFWRKVFDCEVDGVEIHGESLIRFSIKGESFTDFSFLLHQIRKMVALTIGVATGLMDEKYFQIALHSPFRIYVPLVPGWSLLLKNNQFVDSPKNHYRECEIFPNQRAFAVSDLGSPPINSGIGGSEDEESLPEGASEAREVFLRRVLYPHIIELSCQGEPIAEWEEFSARLNFSVLPENYRGSTVRELEKYYAEVFQFRTTLDDNLQLDNVIAAADFAVLIGIFTEKLQTYYEEWYPRKNKYIEEAKKTREEKFGLN